MNKKTIYIVVAVLVVVIVVGVAGVLLLNNNNGNNETTPTPTPTPATVVDASTLQFNVAEDTNGAVVNFEFSAKDVHTSTVELRVNIPSDSGNYTYILNAGTEESYISMDDGATWTPSDFTVDWPSVGAIFEEAVTQLVHWNGIDATYSYTASTGSSNVVSDIVVNPTLADSLFATS